MKKNMKKLASLLFMVMLVLGLTACSGSADEPIETVVETAYAEEVANFFVANIAGMPVETMQEYVAMDLEELQMLLDQSGIPVTAEAFHDIFSGYAGNVEDFGTYISTDGYNLKGDEETATHTTNVTFDVHQAILTLVFDDDGIVTTGSIDPVYSLGEILEKAALNTVIGMGTVFVVLIFISWVIGLLPKFTGLIEKAGKKKETPAVAPAAPAETPAAVEEELADDLELVAVIAAAIAAYTGTSTDDFVVRSIKRSKTNKWKKA